MHAVRFPRLLVASLLALLALTPAFADPVHNPNAQRFTVTCAGEELSVVNPGNRGVPAIVLDDTRVLVLQESVVTLTFIDPETGQPTTITDAFRPGQSQKPGLAGELTTCTGSFTFEDRQLGTVTISFTAFVLATPHGQ